MIKRDSLQKYLKENYLWADYTSLLSAYRVHLPAERIGTYYEPVEADEVFFLSFRFNLEEGYNDIERNNDLQVVVQRTKGDDGAMGIIDRFYNVTIDPRTKKRGIAHFANQIYKGNVGYHRPVIYGTSRICIRSDAGCWYFRTGEKGYRFGCIGLNKHNSNYFWNSSLGCEIYEDEDIYRNEIKPFLRSIKNKDSIPCAIISLEFILEYFGGKV